MLKVTYIICPYDIIMFNKEMSYERKLQNINYLILFFKPGCDCHHGLNERFHLVKIIIDSKKLLQS